MQPTAQEGHEMDANLWLMCQFDSEKSTKFQISILKDLAKRKEIFKTMVIKE